MRCSPSLCFSSLCFSSLCAVLALAVVPPAFSQSSEIDRIIAAERAFAADFPELGLAGSFTKWSEPSAVMLAEGGARTVETLFRGAPRFRQPDEPLISWWPVFAGIAASEDLGFTTGPAVRERGPDGHYFTVWRRQRDGGWRWIYDGGSGSSPTGQPGPESEPRTLPVSTTGSTSPEAAMEEVRAAEARLAQMARSDQKTAHLAHLAPEGRLYVAPLPPAEGPLAFAAALEGWPDTFRFGATEGGGASAAGDLAWTYGPAEWRRDATARRGHYVRVWQKRPEGWRIIIAQLLPATIAAPPPAED